MKTLAQLVEQRQGYAVRSLPGIFGEKPRARVSKRYLRTAVAVLISLVLVGLFSCVESNQPEVQVEKVVEEDPNFPPLYEAYHERELALSQHDISLPPPEGQHAKFFWAANHVHASGWGNALQELFLNAHLAHTAKRSFVFDNYTWDRFGPEYSEYNGNLIPSRIPLTALISGPIVGDPLPPGDNVPRAVSKNWFQQVCPNRTVIHSKDVNGLLSQPSAATLFKKWVEKLNSIEDPCVEIDMNSDQLFDIWIFGSDKVLDIWPTLSQSPVLTQFGWSPLILSAFESNKALFIPPPSLLSFLPSIPWLSHSEDPYAPIPGLLALHIRRGDFEQHCHHLATWSSNYNGFNAFPNLPESFSIPPGAGWGENTPENRAIYLKHCYPTIEQIVEKVMDIRQSSKGIRRVYIMTNAKQPWIQELRVALSSAAEWDGIVSSRDLQLNWEQKYVAQAVDMLIGQRAQMFVGNGFSSLTSNIVMIRMAKRFPPSTIRFW